MKKLLTVNIEGDRHLDKVQPFLAEENSDIICLQEVFRDDIQDLVGSEFQIEFLPMCLKERASGELAQWGIAIATRIPPWRVVREYYYQPTTSLVPAVETSLETKRRTYRQGLIGTSVFDDAGDLTVFVTHFTWTPNGLSNENQSHDMERLLSYLKEQGPHILCGDFNIPRIQNAVYPVLTSHYTDHVPHEYTTSMHLPLHRRRDHPVEGPRISSFMVDYILSTPNTYAVSEVVMRCGMSDHCALTASIEKLT